VRRLLEGRCVTLQVDVRSHLDVDEGVVGRIAERQLFRPLVAQAWGSMLWSLISAIFANFRRKKLAFF
jgi:hypothetical protein